MSDNFRLSHYNFYWEKYESKRGKRHVAHHCWIYHLILPVPYHYIKAKEKSRNKSYVNETICKVHVAFLIVIPNVIDMILNIYHNLGLLPMPKWQPTYHLDDY